MRFKKGHDYDDLDGALIRMIEDAEEKADEEFVITSGLRPGSRGSHSEGLAVDIRCKDSHKRARFVAALTAAGFCRIGLYDLHIHVDIAVDRPQNVLWIGVSQ